MISNKNSWKKKIMTRKPLVCPSVAVGPVNYQIGFATRNYILYAVGRCRTKIELFSNYSCAFSYVQVTKRVNHRRHHFLRTTSIRANHLHHHHIRRFLHSTASNSKTTFYPIYLAVAPTHTVEIYIYYIMLQGWKRTVC